MRGLFVLHLCVYVILKQTESTFCALGMFAVVFILFHLCYVHSI